MSKIAWVVVIALVAQVSQVVVRDRHPISGKIVVVPAPVTVRDLTNEATVEIRYQVKDDATNQVIKTDSLTVPYRGAFETWTDEDIDGLLWNLADIAARERKPKPARPHDIEGRQGRNR